MIISLRFTVAAALALISLACANKPAGPATMVVTRPDQYKVINQPFGSLTWFVSDDQHNCGSMTVGQAVLKPGMESPRHLHPNCDEVLHVVKGTIEHALEGGKTVTMNSGDTITIPMNTWHNAKNIGKEDALLFLSFSSAQRKIVHQ